MLAIQLFGIHLIGTNKHHVAGMISVQTYAKHTFKKFLDLGYSMKTFLLSKNIYTFHLIFNQINNCNTNFSSKSWSGPCLCLDSYAKESLSIDFHACIQYLRDWFRVRSVSQAAPSIPIVCWGWSLITWIGFDEFSLHSWTAAYSLAFKRLSRSRDEKMST